MDSVSSQTGSPTAWADAVTAARIIAVDAAAVRGVVLRAAHGPVREAWLDRLRSVLPAQIPLRRVPAQISEERVMGGLDLAATFARGKPVLQRGVLAECHRGVAVVAMAERLERGIAARVAATLDSGEVHIERDGFSLREPAVLGVVLLDESTADEPGVAPVLRDQVAIWLDLHAVTVRDTRSPATATADAARARRMLTTVRSSDEAVLALCSAAAALGIHCLRAPFMALQVARVLAALDERSEINEDDLRTAARLVLGPRARQLPAHQEPAQTDPSEASPAPSDPTATDTQTAAPDPTPMQQSCGHAADVQELSEKVLAAAQAAIPADLLLRALTEGAVAATRAGVGRAGALHASMRRGRPAGVRKGMPRPGSRLSVIDTLRAAAPWQRLRRAEAPAGQSQRLQLRAADFHIQRYQQRSETLTVFVVDASGSAAMHRLAEAKGAVELLLAQCYVRRDRVAVIAFRNKTAEVLLPPSRSLVRARRSMASLPGGGGTPLAAALHAALHMAEATQRAGLSPTLVFLTDGRGNLTLAGTAHRAVAEQEALTAARALRAGHWRSILIDTSARPAAAGNALAQAMGARYLPLPYADPARLAQAVRRVSEAAA